MNTWIGPNKEEYTKELDDSSRDVSTVNEYAQNLDVIY